MSPDKPQNPDALDATLKQTDEDIDRAAQLSVTQSTVTAPSAPSIPGYKPIARVGEGAYGQVWRAIQSRTNKEVAVKIFTQRGGLDWLFLQRETERLTKLDRHPHVITLLDSDLANDPPFYVMDLVEKGSLQQFVGQGERVTNDMLIRWTHQICQALAYVHNKGLIHCDLKPANILLDEQNNVRVVDFGQSRVFTESAASLGTLYFMAPEQATMTGAGHPPQPDVRWDIYALGATIYAILVGHPPRASQKSDRTLVSATTLEDRLTAYRRVIASESLDFKTPDARKIPHEFAAIIARCLEPDPAKRYESVNDVEDDLDNLVANRPVSPLARHTAYRTRKFVQRNMLRIALVVALIIVGVSAFIAEQRQARLAPIKAQTIASQFVSDPAQAREQVTAASDRVGQHLIDLVERFLDSPAYTDRVKGARAGILVNPEAFWASVDGGPLWQNGEWLEILELNWSDGSEPAVGDTLPSDDDEEVRHEPLDAAILLTQLEEKIESGRDREKYVAYCLLGQLAGIQGLWANHHDDLGTRCVEAVRTETAPGVVAAAKWAANRMGHDVTFETRWDFLVDELTGMTFVRIPSSDGFTPGSPSNERARMDDEDLWEKSVPIANIMMANTEVTLRAARSWVTSSESKPFLQRKVYDITASEHLGRLLKSMSRSEHDLHPVEWFSLDAANAFCDFLNNHPDNTRGVRYRLPTEAEWEYASRSGHKTAFCYGDDPRYANHFAVCEGAVPDYRVASLMPNWYGLHDMHGGVKERCSSQYIADELQYPELHNQELYALRGGAFYSARNRCRSAQREYADRVTPRDAIGFRLVMELPSK